MSQANILSDYEINSSTMAIIVAAQLDYYSIAIERNGSFPIRKSPLELIKRACLEGGSSYEGRRIAVHYFTGIKHKAPIPINPQQGLFAFPTLSPSQFSCAWLFYHHIASIKPITKGKKAKQTLITFKNKEQLTLPISHYILQKQYQRTSQCIVQFSNFPLGVGV